MSVYNEQKEVESALECILEGAKPEVANGIKTTKPAYKLFYTQNKYEQAQSSLLTLVLVQ